MGNGDLLRSERTEEHIQRHTMARADRLNAMNSDLCQALHDALDGAAADRSCRVVVLTGAGRGFCAGLDLLGYGDPPDASPNDQARNTLGLQEHMSRLILKLRATPQPVIAAVNGPAAGFGFALALAGDIRYAARSAVFRAAFMNMGLSNCDMATIWLLPRLIGASRSNELMLTMRKVGAEEAERIGLVAAVLDDDALLEHALGTARQIAALSPWGVRLTKQGMWSALEMSTERIAVEYEDRQQQMAFHSPAVAEAVSAFLEKRPASFAD
jgi:enoyl-CoA hydratase